VTGDKREDHLAWCKKRALEYVDAGELVNAVTSMGSDLNKHPETSMDNPFLLMAGALEAQKGDVHGVRRWIEGFR
jgi:uncharacterized membrane-anchored protein